MDVLTDVLRTVRLQSVIHGRLELTAPWGIRLREGNPPTFLVVARGSCWLEVEGKAHGAGGMESSLSMTPAPTRLPPGPIPLAGGDFVFLPRGRAFTLRDAPGSPALSIQELLNSAVRVEGRVLRYGGGGAPAALVCGCFHFEHEGMNPILE